MGKRKQKGIKIWSTIINDCMCFRYLLQCSVPSYKESTSHKKEKVKVIKFDLEICLLPRLDMLGEPTIYKFCTWANSKIFHNL